MKQIVHFLLAVVCVLPPAINLKADNDLTDNYFTEVSKDHGVGVLKEVVNGTAQPVLIRFADSAYPPLKPHDSTTSFTTEDLPLKTAAVFSSMMIMGIVGLAAMNSNPQERITNMQNRLNKPGEDYSDKVNTEKERLAKAHENPGSVTGGPGQAGGPATNDETINARAAAESKWANFKDKHRADEDANQDLEKKLQDPHISEADKKKLKKQAEKLQTERTSADTAQQRMQDAQRKGGMINTIKTDYWNIKNEARNERSGFSNEINQWKAMRGQNTAEERESDKAYYQALEKMTPAEQAAAKAQRAKDKATQKAQPIDAAAEKKKYWASARSEGGFNNDDGTQMSKTQMTKKVLWNRALGKGETSKVAAKTRGQKIKGMAKVAAFGALIGAVPATLVALSDSFSSLDSTSKMITSLIPWEIPDGKFRCPISKNPLLLGFGTTLIPSFSEGSILEVKRMMGVGAAWLQNPLPTPLNFTLTFKLRINDAGGAHILLRNGLNFETTADDSVNFKTKIILGGFDNTTTAISDRGTIVAQVKSDQYPAAAIPPGIFAPYWLSYNQGLIMLGFGQPGNNVILTWHDPDFDITLDHIGLSCDKSKVEFTELYFAPALTSSLFPKQYILKPEEITLSSSTTWLANSFREPGRGTVALQKKGNGPATISIALTADDNAPQIKIPVGSKYSEPITIQYKNTTTNEMIEEQIGVVCDPYEPSDDAFETYWVSNLYGQFTIGHSQPITTGSGRIIPPQPGTNLIACVTVPDLATAGTIGISADQDLTSNSITVKNIGIFPATELQEDIPTGYVERRKFSGILKTIYPFAYQLRQADQSIEAHDQISGETWYAAGTPQQLATYFFKLAIDAAGSLSMTELGSPKNPIKFGMSAGAVALQQAAGMLNTTATQVGQSGVDPISQIITAAASIGLAGAAIGVNVSASALNANVKYGFRDQNSYVYTEKAVEDIKTTTNIPPEIQANKAAIDAALTEAETYKQAIDDRFNVEKINQANLAMLAAGARAIRSAEDRHGEQLKFFELYVTTYRKIISRITHPFIVNSPLTKNKIALGLFYINQCIRSLYTGPTDGPQKEIITDTVISLFLDAKQNSYLLNKAVSDDQKRAKLWATWIQELAGQALQSTSSQGFTLNSMFGEYLWFGDQVLLPLGTNGSVYLEAQGLGDIFIGLTDMPGDVRNSEQDLYEIVFGGTNNTKTFMRVKSLGRSVAEISTTENPNAAVDPMSTEKFWVSVKNGTISAGKGEWGSGKLLEWTDPYPLTNARYIGLSTWNSPVTFKNIHVGPAVEDLTPEVRKNILAQTSTSKATSDEQQAKDKLMKDQFKDLASDQDPLATDTLTQNDFERNDQLAYDMLTMPEVDQLTHDILQADIDRAAGGPPPTPQLQTAPRTAAKLADAGKDKKPTAAQQQQNMAQMASGSLSGFFQEWQGVVGKSNDDEPTKWARFKAWVKQKTIKSKSTQTDMPEGSGVAKRISATSDSHVAKKLAPSASTSESTGDVDKSSGNNSGIAKKLTPAPTANASPAPTSAPTSTPDPDAPIHKSGIAKKLTPPTVTSEPQPTEASESSNIDANAIPAS